MPLTLSARVLEVPTPLTFQVIKPRYTSWLMSVVSPYRSTSPAAKMTTDIAGRRYWSMWRGSYLHQLLIVLTLFATPGWQRWSGTPNAPVTAAGADDDVPVWSVLDRVEPDPCRLNGFTLSFHVAACDPALADGTLSRDVWLGGEAPELGVLCSFCFGEPTVSVTQYRLRSLLAATNHATRDPLAVSHSWHLGAGDFRWQNAQLEVFVRYVRKNPPASVLGDMAMTLAIIPLGGYPNCFIGFAQISCMALNKSVFETAPQCTDYLEPKL